MSDTAAEPRKVLVQVDDFAPGKVQLASEPLTLRLKQSPLPNTWETRILSSSGVVLWEKQFDETDEESVPVLTPDDWKTLLANPDFTPRLVFSASVLSLSEKKASPLEFDIPFFLFQALPQLSVSTVPVEVEPEAWLVSEVFLEPLPSGWIVWKVGNSTLKEGLLESTSQFWWQAGTKPGTAEMAAEWYPEKPEAGAAPLPAPVRVITHPVVTTTPRVLPGELAPEASYGSLWHFRGTVTNRHNGEKLRVAAGDPAWSLENGNLVLGLTKGASLTGPGLTELTSTPQPFTLNWSLRPDAEATEFAPWQTLDPEGNPLLQFVMLDGNRPAVRLYSAKGVFQELGGKFSLSTDKFSTLSVSFLPSKKDWQVFWTLDGTMRQSGQFLDSLGLPSSFGGVEQSWTGPMRWDEFGVFLKTSDGIPSVDTEIFLRAMKARYGSELVLAEGFDSKSVPNGWEMPAAPVNLALPLQPGEVVRSPSVNLIPGTYQMELAGGESLRLALGLSAVDSEGLVLWKATKNDKGVLVWEWTTKVPVQVRFEWKNTGIEVLSLDELAIFRKMD